MQYGTGTVNVANGSNIVVGVGTLFVANVPVGSVFSKNGSGVPYIVAQIDGDTQLRLASNYAGATENGIAYRITTSFTPNHQLAYPEAQDIDTHTILKRSMVKIDTILGAALGAVGNANRLVHTDASGNLKTSAAATFNESTGAVGFTGQLTLDVDGAETQAIIGRATASGSSRIFIGESASADKSIVVGYNAASNYGYISVSGDTDTLKINDGGGVDLANTLTLTKSTDDDFVALKLSNPNVGTVAQAGMQFSTSAATARGGIQHTGGGYTSIITWDRQDGLYAETSGAGGIALAARHASGIVSIHTGGNGERARATAEGYSKASSDGAYAAPTGAYHEQVQSSAAATNPVNSFWHKGTAGDNIFTYFATEGTWTSRGFIDYNRAGGLVRYNTSSDADLKNILGDADPGISLGILRGTRMRSYAWKEDPLQKPQIGPIAQELFAVVKGAVSEGRDVTQYDGLLFARKSRQPWAVDRTAFVNHLVVGWQQHDSDIARIKAHLGLN